MPRLNVPVGALDLIRVHVRDRTLEPVARLSTSRTITVLIGQAGRDIAEFSDDTVDAVDLRTGEGRHWREWEVELLGGEGTGGAADDEAAGQQPGTPDDEAAALLDAVEARLLQTGAAPAQRTAKLARAVGGTPERWSAVDASPKSVRAVLTPAFRELADQLKSWDPRVRRDEEDSIHQLRVCARTLRSMLKTYEPLLDADRAQDLEARLQTIGRILGDARDAEVLRDRIPARIARQRAGLIPQKESKRLANSAAKEYRKAHDAALKELDSAEYFRALDALDEFTARLPLRDDGGDGGGEDDGGKAARHLPRCARRQQRRVRKFAARAAAEQDPGIRLSLLHDVRKKSKRLRYAVTAVSRTTGFDFGKDLDSSMQSAKKIQHALGEHRDSVMFQRYLAKKARAAHRAAEDTFGYGLMYAAEERIQEDAEAAYEKALKKLR